MHYKDGDHFERAVFGHYSGGHGYVKYRSFSSSMREAMRGIGSSYPATRLGELLYFGVYEELRLKDVDPSGLKLKPSIRSRADIHHHTDGYFSLLSVPNKPVTVDLFNLDSEIYWLLRDRWKDEYLGELPEYGSQTLLFKYKLGMSDFWKQSGDKKVHWDHIFRPFDFCSNERRPESHLILTPEHTENRLRRKQFCKLVADYFAKVVKESDHENTALLSHK